MSAFLNSLLIFLIDESSSMQKQRQDVIKGVNELLENQRFMTPEVNSPVELITFNNIVSQPINFKLHDKFVFDESKYNPINGTALYDAIGQTIHRHQEKKNVVMVIATDGQDMNSRQYSSRTIKELIDQKKTQDGWKFIYLADNLEAEQAGQTVGLASLASCNNSDPQACQSVSMTMSSGSARDAIYSARMGFDSGPSPTSSGHTSPSPVLGPMTTFSLATNNRPTESMSGSLPVFTTAPSDNPQPATWALPRPKSSHIVCNNWKHFGTCPFGDQCRFKHSSD